MIGTLVFLVGFALADEPAPEPFGEALSDEAYRFCHEAGKGGSGVRDWCDLLEDAPPERCPGLRETCASDEPLEDSVLFSDLFAGCAGGAPGPIVPTAPGAPEEPRSLPKGCEPEESWSCQQGEGLVRWVAAVIAALAVLVVVRILLAVFARRRERPDAASVPVDSAVVVVPTHDDDLPPLASPDLLAAARDAYAAGRFGDALLAARAAALRRLGEQGRLRIHRARTDREYARDVRRDPDVHGPLTALLGAVERFRWRGDPPGEEEVVAALTHAERILSVAGAIGLALVALWGSPAAAEDRYGPSGDAALADLYAEYGFDVSWRLRGLREIEDDVDVLVIDLSRVAPDVEDWEALSTWTAGGGVLVLAGSSAFEPFGLGATVDVVDDGPPRLTAIGAMLNVPLPMLPEGMAAAWPEPSADDAWVVTASDFAVVRARAWGDGGVLAVSDARLVTNAALVADSNRAFLGHALYNGEDASVWALPDEGVRLQLATRAGVGQTNPIDALRYARLLPFVAQLLLLLAIGAWWRGWSLAVPRDPPEEGRVRFVAHARALAGRWQRLRATGHAARAYARWALEQHGEAGIEAAARRAGLTASEAAVLVRRVEERAASDASSGQQDLRFVEELWQLIRER